MNAYELADELENYVWMNPNNNRDYCKEVKDMLRQQADRIAELEKLFNNCNVSDFTPPQKAIIRQGFEKYWGEIWERYTKETTPQIKELSDEEILNLYKETEADNGGIREFARAILKKASEK